MPWSAASGQRQAAKPNTEPEGQQFTDFFKKHFVKVTKADREEFKFSAANDVDVVVLDWSHSEGGLEKTSVPFGPLQDWPKPTVLLNHSGLLVAGLWDDLRGNSDAGPF